jgi:hypothetical protein
MSSFFTGMLTFSRGFNVHSTSKTGFTATENGNPVTFFSLSFAAGPYGQVSVSVWFAPIYGHVLKFMYDGSNSNLVDYYGDRVQPFEVSGVIH